jgi:hypothetical protein
MGRIALLRAHGHDLPDALSDRPGWEVPAFSSVDLFPSLRMLSSLAAGQYAAVVLGVAADLGPAPLPADVLRLARHAGMPLTAVFLSRCEALDDHPDLLDMVEQDVRLWLADQGFPADDVPVFRGEGELPRLFAAVPAPPAAPARRPSFLARFRGIRMVTGRGNVVACAGIRGEASPGDALELIDARSGSVHPCEVTATLTRQEFGPTPGFCDTFLRLEGVSRHDIRGEDQWLGTPGLLRQYRSCEAVVWQRRRAYFRPGWLADGTIGIPYPGAFPSWPVRVRVSRMTDWDGGEIARRIVLTAGSRFTDVPLWPAELVVESPDCFPLEPGACLSLTGNPLLGHAVVTRVTDG